MGSGCSTLYFFFRNVERVRVGTCKNFHLSKGSGSRLVKILLVERVRVGTLKKFTRRKGQGRDFEIFTAVERVRVPTSKISSRGRKGQGFVFEIGFGRKGQGLIFENEGLIVGT